MYVTKRILFVDDDLPVRKAFARTLRMHNFQVDLADSFASAEQMLQTNDYAVIATDYRMPRINGLELVARFELQSPHTTFILVTGDFDMDRDLSQSGHTAIDEVISKPWDTHHLVELMQQGIRNHQTRLNLSRQAAPRRSRSLSLQQTCIIPALSQGITSATLGKAL